MPVFQMGPLNLAGTLAPGVYTQVVAPPAVVRGVSTNGLGQIGVASWGPVNSPTVIGSPQMAALMLGPVTVRKSDLATAMAIAFGLGQQNNTAVRVTDGSDTAATCAVKDGSAVTGVTLTGFYTGVVGNTREKGRARIVNTASVMAFDTDYGLAAYCASKAGVGGLTRTLALELGKFNITANYVCPGAIYTGMTHTNFDKPEIRAVWEKKAALRRLGQPIDIARGALLLASDEADFITGHELVVDGGLTLRT